MQISEEMLLFSPEYARRNALPMYVPGGLLEQHLTFTKPVVLFVSKSNPGAGKVAEEMM